LDLAPSMSRGLLYTLGRRLFLASLSFVGVVAVVVQEVGVAGRDVDGGGPGGGPGGDFLFRFSNFPLLWTG